MTFPGAYTLILSFILGLGGLFAVIYGAAIAGLRVDLGHAQDRRRPRREPEPLPAPDVRGDRRHGRRRACRRVRVGVVVALVGASIAGVSTAGLGDTATLDRLPELLVRGWLAIVEEGALGFAIATLARSQLAGIGAGIALYFGETFAGDLPARHREVPALQRGDRGRRRDRRRRFGGGGGTVVRLDPNVALLVVAAWLVGAIVVSAVRTERAEISG